MIKIKNPFLFNFITNVYVTHYYQYIVLLAGINRDRQQHLTCSEHRLAERVVVLAHKEALPSYLLQSFLPEYILERVVACWNFNRKILVYILTLIKMRFGVPLYIFKIT